MKYEVDFDILRKEILEVGGYQIKKLDKGFFSKELREQQQKHLRDKADLILTLIMMLFPTIGD